MIADAMRDSVHVDAKRPFAKNAGAAAPGDG
jgi:hypothetical protein